MVIISDQIAQSAVNFQVGYKVRHPIIQAGNDCMRIPVNENYIRFVQLTLEFRYANLRRETNIVTEPAFRRLHCPKEHRR